MGNFVNKQAKKTYNMVSPSIEQAKMNVLSVFDNLPAFAIGGIIAYLVLMRVDLAVVLAVPTGYAWLFSVNVIREYYDEFRVRRTRVVKVEHTDPYVLLVDSQVERHSQPQSMMNRLANYVPVVDDDEVEPFEEEFVDVARKIILEFTVRIYQEQLIDSHGFIDNQQIAIPWGQRSIRRFTPDIRKLIRQLIHDLSQSGGLYEFVDSKKQWRVRTDLYLTVEDAVSFVDRVPSRVFTEGVRVVQ